LDDGWAAVFIDDAADDSHLPRLSVTSDVFNICGKPQL